MGGKASVPSPAILRKNSGAANVGTAVGKTVEERIGVNAFAAGIAQKKPSLSKAIADTMRGIKINPSLGGGYYSVGELASDFVYETALNDIGGTNGTFDVRARFGCQSPVFNKSGGNITFSVQMGDNISGVSCVAYSFASADLPSTGRATRVTLTHSGGGLFTGSVAPSVAWSDFLGVEVKLDPVDSTNDETLHQESMVVKRVLFVQDAVEIFDTNVARASDGAYLAQIAIKAVNTTFWPEQVTIDTKTYLLNHSRFMTGATVEACWVSKTGIDTGYGDINAPVNAKRAGMLSQLGAAEKFLLKEPGIWDFPGQKAATIFAFTGVNFELVAPNGPVYFRLGHWFDMESLTWSAGGFDVPYTYTNHDAASNITSGATKPKLIRQGEKPLTEVLTLGEVATTEKSYYWDLANSKFVVNVPDLSIQLIAPECDTIIKATRAGYVKVCNVFFDCCEDNFIQQLHGDAWCEFYSTGVYGGTINGDIFRHEEVQGFGVDCIALGAGNDGFNYHKSGRFTLFDPIAKNCKGDGISPHENCELEVYFGEVRDNVRAGVVTAYGAKCTVYGTELENNAIGLTGYGNLMALSDDSLNSYDGTAQKETVLVAVRCVTTGGQYGLVSRGVTSTVIDFKNEINTPSINAVASLDQLGTGYGKVLTFDRAIDDIEYTEFEKVGILSQ